MATEREATFSWNTVLLKHKSAVVVHPLWGISTENLSEKEPNIYFVPAYESLCVGVFPKKKSQSMWIFFLLFIAYLARSEILWEPGLKIDKFMRPSRFWRGFQEIGNKLRKEIKNIVYVSSRRSCSKLLRCKVSSISLSFQFNDAGCGLLGRNHWWLWVIFPKFV